MRALANCWLSRESACSHHIHILDRNLGTSAWDRALTTHFQAPACIFKKLNPVLKVPNLGLQSPGLGLK